MAGHLDCLDDHGQGECSGPVEFRTTPDRDDFRSFPRCEAHFAKRLDAAERTADLADQVAEPALRRDLALAALLLYRALLKTGLLPRWQGDDGTESPERARA